VSTGCGVRASLAPWLLPGKVLWRVPARFGIASLLGRYSLRCVLFHNVTDVPSPFTDGLGITQGTDEFEQRIRFLATHYTPMSLEGFLTGRREGTLPRRPVLVTFDDAYASVAEQAGPICRKYGVPAVFFVTAAFVDNRELALDNLTCFVVNRYGLEPIRAAAAEMPREVQVELGTLRSVTHEFVPRLTLAQRSRFQELVAGRVGVRPAELAREAGLYVTTAQLRQLREQGFEIGSHTYSHTRCRVFRGGDLEAEVGQNQRALESITGQAVRAFAVPYGSRKDLTPELITYLRDSHHEAAFLVDSVANTPSTDSFGLYRVSVTATTDADTFSEIEILPRLRAVRDAVLRRHTIGRGRAGTQELRCGSSS